MEKPIIIRFGVAAVLISVGCALLLGGIYRGGMFFGIATIFFMPCSELTKPIPRREFWITLGLLFVFIGVSVAAKYLLPSSAADAVQRVVCHPAFVVPLWLFMMWGLYRHYHRQKGGVDA